MDITRRQFRRMRLQARELWARLEEIEPETHQRRSLKDEQRRMNAQVRRANDAIRALRRV